MVGSACDSKQIVSVGEKFTLNLAACGVSFFFSGSGGEGGVSSRIIGGEEGGEADRRLKALLWRVED